ncbi:MAG: class I SAM-dependent methyltransferase [Paracoccaceae bacterium]
MNKPVKITKPAPTEISTAPPAETSAEAPADHARGNSPLGKARMGGLMALNALKSHRLIFDRYIRRKPVIGSFLHEIRLNELYWERKLHSDTDGWVSVALDDGMLYEATPYLVLNEILRTLKLGRDDVFIDLGCGKGRVLCMASRTGAGRVIGVEQDPDFLDVARENLDAMPGKHAKVELFEGLAQDFDFSDATVVFLFNPFGAKTLEQVLDLLAASLKENPRPLRIVYVNPVHEAVLHQTPWLTNSTTWPSDAFPEFQILPTNPRMVSFWDLKNNKP